MSKTPVVYDFASIRAAADPGAVPDRRTAPSIGLEQLLAENERAWDAVCDKTKEAELLWFAYRDEHPGARAPEDYPPHIAALYAEAEQLAEPARALIERINDWIPDNLADAIRLLEHEHCEPEGAITGLKIIAAAGDPVAAEPVTGDRRIMGLLREWRVAVDWANRPGDRADSVVDADGARVAKIEDAITETPAETAAGIAVKVFLETYYENSGDDCTLAPSEGRSAMTLSAIADIARLVPELAPLCAPALAPEA